jgi:Flp pilus assembly protein TadD
MISSALGPAIEQTPRNRIRSNRFLSNERARFALGLFLAAATIALFWACTENGLVYDDQAMVAEGSFVQQGLTADNLWRAFTSVEAAHWHPLVWISFEAEYGLGLGPRGFHVSNIILHALNAWLLYHILCSMTGMIWRSALAAALFAIHPLHVESVAWVAERKDVLSTLFWLLATRAYVAYARAPSSMKMAGVAGLMAMGLLAKSMLVTLPLTLLVLDWWPLGRTRNPTGAVPWRDAVGEKLPLFVLALCGAMVQLWAQHVRGKSEVPVPWDLRLENALVAPVIYLRKMILPSDLAAFYPYPSDGYAGGYVVLCGLVLLGFTVISLYCAGNRPYLLAGWLWYLITLAPVSGILQVVGGQAYADRYTYVPMIGIALCVSWTVAESATAALRPVTVAACVAWLMCLAWISNHQIETWHDNLRLWQRAVAVTQNNYFALNNLGVALEKEGRSEEATESYRRSCAAKPSLGVSHNNLGRVLETASRLQEAELEYRNATELDPGNAQAWRNLARLLGIRGRWHEAVDAGRRARELKPQDAGFRLASGIDLLHAGDFQGAEHQVKTALRLDAEGAEAWYYLGTIQMIEGDKAGALESLSRAAHLKPEPAYFYALSQLLRQMNRVEEANQLFAKARIADPAWIKVANHLAWTMSTSPDASMRNGRYALWLANQICQTVDEKNAACLETLAAAQAEMSEFSDARATLSDWLARFGPQASPEKRGAIERQLRRYERHEPYRVVNAK